jgi:hypothetical protein
MRYFALPFHGTLLQWAERERLTIYPATLSLGGLPEEWLVLTERTFNYAKDLMQNAKIGGFERGVLERAVALVLGDGEKQVARTKVHYTLESFLQDPPHADVLDEIILFLHVFPHLSLEYIGRGSGSENVSCLQGKPNAGQIFMLDIAGGRRKYHWKAHEASFQFHSPSLADQFRGLTNWFSEPNCRIVLSLGGGGLRMLGATTLLKILDGLNLRPMIDEIWGTSGGSIVGYLYSIGVPPHQLEQIGYDFYNEKYPEITFLNSSATTFFKFLKTHVRSLNPADSGLVALTEVLSKMVGQAHRYRNTQLSHIPFFGLAVNGTLKRPFALTPETGLAHYFNDFISYCEPLSIIEASSAIPMVFSPKSIHASRPTEDMWVDGGLAELVPMLFPARKWFLDKQHHAVGRRKKLKIFYLDLGMRFSEAETIFAKLPAPLRSLVRTLDYFDLASETTLVAKLEALQCLPDIEIEGTRLELGKIASLTTRDIVYVIQQARRNLVPKLLKISQAMEEGEYLQSESEAS